MTDGELKRQISKQFVSNHYSQPRDVFPVLDAAAKEFPLRQNVIGIATENIPEGEELYGKVRSVTLNDAIAWFEKWFGSEQK
jgi:hypothetical protein